MDGPREGPRGRGAAVTAAIEQFRIAVDDGVLGDLRDRLVRTRLPDQIDGTGWEYGVPAPYLRDLVDHWRDTYDWRAAEARLNELEHFRTTIDGQSIHFVHARSAHAGARPLLLTHGWPGSIVEFLDVIPRLTTPEAYGGDPADAFHVVAPSLPGYGFSGPTRTTGWDVSRIARAWAALMDRLGYSSYGAQGGDWGARISPELARVDPSHVTGVHANAFVALPSGDPGELEGLTPADCQRLSRLGRWREERSGYAQIQSTRPQTLAYGLADSPVGQLGWYTEWFDG